MKNRILALSCLCLLVLNLAGSAVGDVKRKAGPGLQLAALLPATDGIVTIDVNRFFSVALPGILAGNPNLLGEITAGLDEAKATTGIDFRQFDHMAVGVTAKKLAEKKYDITPVVIARGQQSSAALIEAATAAAKGTHREEKAGVKTIYIFTSKMAVDKAKQQLPAQNSGALNKAAAKMPKEIAVSAIDESTIVFGDLALVRKAISQKPTVKSELMVHLAKKEASIVNFAGKLPGGMSAFIPLDNDELGKNIDSIQFVYGNMDMVGDGMALNVTARTLQSAQATALLETLEGLQMIGKAFLGGSQGVDKKVYSRLIDNARFSAKGNEVIFDLHVAQADIDVLAGMLK